MFRSISKTVQILKKTKFNFNRYYGDRFNFELKVDADTCLQDSRVLSLVEHYRKYGHNFSSIDPLNLNKNPNPFPDANEFGLKYQDLVQEDLQSKGFATHLSEKTAIVNVDHLESALKGIYTGHVGVEFSHLSIKEERDWLYQNFERVMLEDLAPSEKLNIHQLLIQTEALDHFLHKKYNTFKRYALEGAETMVVGLRNIFAKASEKGVKEVVLGMPHRGRLNVLVNLLDYPARDLFFKISGNNDLPEELYTGVDDVVSHIAVSNKKTFRTGGPSKEKEISVSLMHNPSHLEAVNPVSMGKAKAKQDDNNSTDNVLNVQLHGDAAFSGQGIVFETFAMIKTPKYSVGGTVHMIVNNQIGYTTTPRDGRSSKYCSDIAKSFDVPVIHVNAEDPEAVHRVSKLAVEFRQTFKKEIIIDLVAYRRFGHNEVDEPEFTQPSMYKIIRSPKKTSPESYHERLVGEGLVGAGDFSKIREKAFAFLEKEFEESGKVKRSLSSIKNQDSKGSKTFGGKWKNMDFSVFGKEQVTGLPVNYLKELSLASVALPPSFTPHPRLKKFFVEDRIKSTEQNSIDWPTAEAVAAMSLIDEGYNVRLSGEDVERGTFSQRHWVLVDQKSEAEYSPIKEFACNKGRFQVSNSILSENAVLSYEYGYGLENPNNLVIWEAQFGDFFNPAQAVFDTFITCSEEKWLRQSGLVVLLPHGFDGAGPEHSSMRMERFLLHSASDGGVRGISYRPHDPSRTRLNITDGAFYENVQDINFHLAQPTTPANFFHLIRRQMKRNFRKPLIVASAKTLLRSPNAKSSFEEMAEGTKFKPVISFPDSPSQDKSLIVLCSGKVRYEIQALMKENEGFSNKASLIVIEELMPFPFEDLANALKNASKTSKVVWVQEEPSNSGAYFYVEPRLEKVLLNLGIKSNVQYCGRRSTAVTAVGSSKVHKQEVSQLAGALLKL